MFSHLHLRILGGGWVSGKQAQRIFKMHFVSFVGGLEGEAIQLPLLNKF